MFNAQGKVINQETPLALSPPSSALVVCTRRLGDVLLTTPLIRSIRRAWPQAPIDALVFKGTEGALQGNPDLRHILTIPERPALLAQLHLATRIYRRYSLAVSTLSGDRPILYAWLAGRTCAGFTDPDHASRIKEWMLHTSVPFDNLNTHTVRMNLELANLIGINPVAEVVVNNGDAQALLAEAGLDRRYSPYAVLHPYPKYPYKQWHEPGWLAVSHWLAKQGLRTVLTGGADAEELNYLDALTRQMPPHTVNLGGRASLAQTAAVIRDAAAYVGPDTVTTHIAAATGTPTIALFGPSNPVKWGPWPKGWPAHRNPFVLHGNQQSGNVMLLQGARACVPCMNEGCRQHVLSSSDCLAQMPAMPVIRALDTLLNHQESQPAASRPVIYFRKAPSPGSNRP